MEDASMGEQEKLLRLPNYLVRQPLELFRKLRLADRSYFQVRQILLDLYPESSEASFAKYFAMKLTGQANLETYYREKTAMGLQLGLPQEVILETLTEGLPFNDQRLARVVSPENLGEWFRLVQRIHGPSAPTTRPREDQPPTMSGPYHSTPRHPDNGGQFVSGEFEQFTKMNGIRHTKTSPYNPSTNGLADRYVREFKNLLRKNNGKDESETNLQRFLFAHRAFPQTVIKEYPRGTANEEKFKIKILEFNTKMENPREVFHEAEDEQLVNHVLSDVFIEEPAPDTMINRQTESSGTDRPQRTRTIPKRFDDYVLATTNETIPKDYDEAIACEDKKHWENAMLEEIQNMYSHQVWELVPRPVNAKVIKNESRFCLSSDSRRVRVWRRRGERSNPAAIVERPTVRQRGIMVWGAIAYDSRSPLLRIQGTMTAQRYVDDVLRPVTLPYLQGVPNALYQQDNARPHTARISQETLQDVQMLPWPPYSPDLSPIEHVWDIIGGRLHALPQPRSEDELWQMVEREWRAIPQDAIRTLIDSLPRRVAACIAVRGGPTCY
ncbi:Transposase [Cordylochernes scorpioides]|uniref:Transposase n=1 Tax=Cordylochernes scorpioides TaxID=51811 RepID=A0ABY6LMB4_9ARAC|nr:Transposase [Cordylochernes scorpioides]